MQAFGKRSTRRSATIASASAIEGAKQEAPKDFARDAVLSGLMAGSRQAVYHALPIGEALAFLGQPDGPPAMERHLVRYPSSWAFYSMYMVLKDAIRNATTGNVTPTELDPDDQQASR